MSYSSIYSFSLFNQSGTSSTSDILPTKGKDLKKVCS
ncbi:unnamed protein product, partial [marine sediment metagenome]